MERSQQGIPSIFHLGKLLFQDTLQLRLHLNTFLVGISIVEGTKHISFPKLLFQASSNLHTPNYLLQRSRQQCTCINSKTRKCFRNRIQLNKPHKTLYQNSGRNWLDILHILQIIERGFQSKKHMSQHRQLQRRFFLISSSQNKRCYRFRRNLGRPNICRFRLIRKRIRHRIQRSMQRRRAQDTLSELGTNLAGHSAHTPDYKTQVLEQDSQVVEPAVPETNFPILRQSTQIRLSAPAKPLELWHLHVPGVNSKEPGPKLDWQTDWATQESLSKLWADPIGQALQVPDWRTKSPAHAVQPVFEASFPDLLQSSQIELSAPPKPAETWQTHVFTAEQELPEPQRDTQVTQESLSELGTKLAGHSAHTPDYRTWVPEQEAQVALKIIYPILRQSEQTELSEPVNPKVVHRQRPYATKELASPYLDAHKTHDNLSALGTRLSGHSRQVPDCNTVVPEQEVQDVPEIVLPRTQQQEQIELEAPENPLKLSQIHVPIVEQMLPLPQRYEHVIQEIVSKLGTNQAGHSAQTPDCKTAVPEQAVHEVPETA
ncbi:Hypothetical_protein [Hexamita inflata]|uniref:Hypothetical_protein n=1 Tax=Hexamita inflata TaxID=28002 RepID=A0AA86N501_9EUKA|nr:Hypothetical protein HINF_LOCUS607 [Hexamita inflata]